MSTKLFLGIAIFAVFALIGVTIWNTYNLRELRNQPLRLNTLTDSKYWELYYKIQFQATVFGIVVALAAYIGYSTIKEAKDNLREEMQTAVKKQNDAIEINKKQIEEISGQYQELQNAYPALSNMANDTKSSFTSLQKNFAELSKKDILKQPIYIVNFTFDRSDSNPIPSNWSEAAGGFEFPFSKMKTLSGESIPKFKTIPIVLLFANDIQGQSNGSITKISNESVFIYLGDTQKYDVTLFITEKP